MKKLVLLASIAVAVVAYQPVKAQVSLNINIGSRPYYEPNYYSPNHYYVVPQRVYSPRTVIVKRPVYVPTTVYRSYYSSPANRYNTVRNYRQNFNKHERGHSKGHHKGRH